MSNLLGAITRRLGQILGACLFIGFVVGYPAYAIHQQDWLALVPWGIIMLIFGGMMTGRLPSMRGF